MGEVGGVGSVLCTVVSDWGVNGVGQEAGHNWE